MRHLLLLAALTLVACGDTLVDRAGVPLEGADASAAAADAATTPDTGTTPPDAGAGGLICAADDPCTCAACTSTAQCAAGLSCVEGKRKGQSCGFNVCLTGGL